MFIERLTLTNFRCFGPSPSAIDLTAGLTAFVGANGAGKTAAMQALQRLFGISGEQRRVKRQDFHIPAGESAPATQRTLALEVILAFPELDHDGQQANAVPEFFQQMAADEEGRLKCRLRLEATWTEDSSLDGAIDQKYFVVRTLGAFDETHCSDLKATDRARIQMIYVPASRDGASQVTAFLRGRLWRAVNWSNNFKITLANVGGNLNRAFSTEAAVNVVAQKVTQRWQEVHSAGTDTTPLIRPVDLRFQEFIRKVEVVFHPDEQGRERALEDLSDGQRSLFHIAMTAATLDVEAMVSDDANTTGFLPGTVLLPALTLIAVEEPENNLAPFYLSRIIRQIEDLTKSGKAQAIVSSHSASILARVDPLQVRHFRLEHSTRLAQIRAIRMPTIDQDASKFVREAVKTYPELYFARFVVLGEGASEQVVLPRIAEAMGLNIDQSFVAVVPLGGRHVNHLWRLLTDLDIPHATLLDLDWGRAGGGWGRIKNACQQLVDTGIRSQDIFESDSAPFGARVGISIFDALLPTDITKMNEWMQWLNLFGIYFCAPLDLDYSMLRAFPDAYRVIEPGRSGPSSQVDPRLAVLGEMGNVDLYQSDHADNFRWYRYLFLGRGKPSTHVRVLANLSRQQLSVGAPIELQNLLTTIANRL
ncbi:AAA family ATPase [Lysobacter yananisis]|uniref:AAA family ATPase n=1 Tax=Lysobacter yananisis TaxID=1003114 RepID=A0ABY9P7B4_9GAMM|nr:AAA family ATPase [Lysobacter yananisis]WMT02962.1 AAA family ATPase [Lysobacter yananisis]